MHKYWLLPEPVPAEVDAALGAYAPLERQILVRRGVHSLEQADLFLKGGEPETGDPFLLLGMEEAASRLLQAARRGEPVVVYGDYDADGVTATALLVEVLGGLGARVSAYIPNRFDEGYGLHEDALTVLHHQGARVVVSVDCGIRSVREAEHARALGLDLILTDHHHPGADLPPAFAVINPRLPGDPYPFKELAGVGLAYKLAQALRRQSGGPDPEEHLDLLAVGTIADLAPLQGENRHLVSEGLKRLNGEGGSSAMRPGFRALIRVSGYEPGRVTATAVGFGLGPRLNAAGRLESADKALRLLTTRDPAEAESLAHDLDAANRERQRLTRVTVERARLLGLGPGPIPALIFAAHAEFNAGVVGLAAGRLTEEYYRPAIVASIGEETTRASARSIPGVHITEMLDACADLLVQHGGHAVAAGFTVRNENLEIVVERLRSSANATLGGSDPRPRLEIDAEARFADLDGALMTFIERLEPCGIGNPVPVFASREVTVVQRRAVGSDGSHLKLTLREGGRIFDAIAFRQGHLAEALPTRVDVAYQLERNLYMGVETPQLNVQDIRPSGQKQAEERD